MATHRILINGRNADSKRKLLLDIPAPSLLTARIEAHEQAKAAGMFHYDLQDHNEVSAVFAKHIVGRRIEIPVHYDLWMRGARTGVVRSVIHANGGIRVKMDNENVKRLARIWRIDLSYIKVLD